MTHRISSVEITSDYGIGAVIVLKPMIDEGKDALSDKFNAPAMDFRDLPKEVRLALRAWIYTPRLMGSYDELP